jgi:hypothetical protein
MRAKRYNCNRSKDGSSLCGCTARKYPEVGLAEEVALGRSLVPICEE